MHRRVVFTCNASGDLHTKSRPLYAVGAWRLQRDTSRALKSREKRGAWPLTIAHESAVLHDAMMRSLRQVPQHGGAWLGHHYPAGPRRRRGNHLGMAQTPGVCTRLASWQLSGCNICTLFVNSCANLSARRSRSLQLPRVSESMCHAPHSISYLLSTE